jgi:hypothetical protein
MVTTTSAARTTSSVHGLGYSAEMSMPGYRIAAMAEGLIVVAGSEPPDQARARSSARCWKNPRAIWGAAGVVGAQEQHHRHSAGVLALDLRQSAQPLPGEPLGE